MKSVFVLLLIFTFSEISATANAAFTISPDDGEDGEEASFADNPSVQEESLVSGTKIRVFREQEDFFVTDQIRVNVTEPGFYNQASDTNGGGTINAGISVDTYFLHADRSSSGSGTKDLTTKITFEHSIIGIQLFTGTLIDGDDLFGLSGVSFPDRTQNNNDSHDLELNPASDTRDTLLLSTDRRVLTVRMRFSGNMDQLRVITATPERSSFVLLSAFVFAAFCRRNRDS